MIHCLDDKCKNGCIAYEIAFGSRNCNCGYGCNCKVSCNDATIELEDRDCDVLLRASYKRGEYSVSIKPNDHCDHSSYSISLSPEDWDLLRRYLNKSARLFDRNFSVKNIDINWCVFDGEDCDNPNWNYVPTLEITYGKTIAKISVGRSSYVNIEIGTLNDKHEWSYALAFDQQTWEAIVSFVDRRMREEPRKEKP